MTDSLHERGQAMEAVFFAQQDQKLLDKLREEIAAKESREALQAASGIKNEAVLDALTETGITPESLTSVALIPLVTVAWADNKLDDSEKAAILKAADVAGLQVGSASYQTMESWLAQKPGAALLDVWKAYIGSLKETLDPVAFSQLKTSVVGRAVTVAESAGGFLGLVNKISDSEQNVIDQLNAAFD